MKASKFDYVRAGSVNEICALLEENGPQAKLIAGGQSLVPMLAMRLTKTALLIDVNDVEELKGITAEKDKLVIGGGTRQYMIEASTEIERVCPMIQQALYWVGHPQTRNRGTIGGSLVHADPSAELPLAALLLDADIIVRGPDGEEAIAAEDFFLAPLVTALEADQCVVRVEFPFWKGNVGGSFHEVSPRRGDFAMVSAAVQIQLDEGGRCTRAAVGLGGVAATPIRVESVEGALVGQVLNADRLRDIARIATDEIEPESDMHASAEYRMDVACTLIERAIADAQRGARTVTGATQ